MKIQKIILTIALTISFNLFASSGAHLKHANTDIGDQKSLQNGAKIFMNYCAGCHSIKFMRYNRLAKDLNIDQKTMETNLIFTGAKFGEPIVSSIDSKKSKKWFGVTPPDLSLTARSRGVDWIYTYLTSFYKDDSRPFGVNNHILKNAAMPDVLWSMKANLSHTDYNKQIRDITNFLDYVSEPIKIHRVAMGMKVIAFLLVLFILAFLLKKEYWRDVKYGKWRKQ
jgi:ubiquinol-cytochrome c reductase cytochrome c1 subunit